MKLTLELNSYEEMKLHAHALDAFKVLDLLENELSNDARRYYKKDEIKIQEGILLAKQTCHDLMEKYGLYGIYNEAVEIQ